MKYRDHYPANDKTRPQMRDAYEDTRALYVQVFNEPEEALWPKNMSSTCGDSYSGFIPHEDRALC
jgi:hypothetical protein